MRFSSTIAAVATVACTLATAAFFAPVAVAEDVTAFVNQIYAAMSQCEITAFEKATSATQVNVSSFQTFCADTVS
ncbi:hypothetical protein HK405_006348 [Cladochytrium tenue]|nr:hypothetical protein HK405_006348 [Cladochytrium tenue]